MSLPVDSTDRKGIPIVSGVLDYFPDAIAGVARVSQKGNDKHNPGEPLHWSRDKSPDHRDCIGRHLLEPQEVDEDGELHSVHAAWRALANAQIELEGGEKTSPERPEKPPTFTVDKGGKAWYNTPLAGWGESRGPARGTGYRLSPEERDDLKEYLVDDCETSPSTASLILAGITLPDPWFPADRHQMVYIAGPMRGHPDNNTAAFDEARNLLVSKGYAVISPADMDRAAAVPIEPEPADSDIRKYALRDFHALHFLGGQDGDAIAMLPGWEDSIGATAEFFMARWLKLRVLDATTAEEAPEARMFLMHFPAHPMKAQA